MTNYIHMHFKTYSGAVQKHSKRYQLRFYAVFWLILVFLLQILSHNIRVTAAENMAVVIRSQQIEAYNEAITGFEKGCNGKNISITALYDLKGDTEEGKKVIQNIKEHKNQPSIIFAVGVLAATLVKEQFTDIPIIFCMVINHKRFNLEGNNITGISSEASVEEQFAILKKLIGTPKNIGIIYDPSKTSNIVLEATLVSEKEAFNLVKTKITSENEILSALKDIMSKIDALWIIPDSTVITKGSINLICKTILEHHLPIFCTSEALVKAGALVSISPHYAHIGLQAAQIAQTLLNNPTVISLGVRKPDTLKVTLNTQTAKILGINLSAVQSLPGVVLYP